MLNFIASFLGCIIGCILGNKIADKTLNRKGGQYYRNNRMWKEDFRMITKIIIILSFIIALILFIISFTHQEEDFIIKIVLGSGLSILGFLLSFIIIGFITNIVATFKGDYAAISIQPLKAIDIDEDLHGSFFLGCGSINSADKFIYIAKVDNLGYKVQEVDIDDCYIVEENIEQPYLEISNIKWRDWVVTSKDRYIFHIPPNSIKENYEVNIND